MKEVLDYLHMMQRIHQRKLDELEGKYDQISKDSRLMWQGGMTLIKDALNEFQPKHPPINSKQ